MPTRDEQSQYKRKDIINLLQKCEQEHGKVVQSTYSNYVSRSKIVREFESTAHAKIEAGIQNIGAVRSKHMRKLLNEKIENDKYINDVITGLMMSDASATKNTDTRNTQIQIEMVNKEFLEYIRNILGPLATDVKTYTKTNKTENEGEFTIEVYKLRTRRLKSFNKYRDDWYINNEKIFPVKDIELNPTILKMWYVGDGDISTDKRWNIKHYARITSVNEFNRKENINNLFNSLSFEPNWNDGPRFTFGLEGSKEFWKYIGEPTPGYEYKWPDKEYYM